MVVEIVVRQILLSSMPGERGWDAVVIVVDVVVVIVVVVAVVVVIVVVVKANPAVFTSR